MNWILVVAIVANTSYEAASGPKGAGDHVVTFSTAIDGITHEQCQSAVEASAGLIVDACNGKCTAVTACIPREPEGEAL